MTVIAEPIAAPPSAWRNPGYRAHFGTYVLAMMADNVEHVISYRMTFQKFQSPALGGFAVVSHWLPFLLFSVAAGGLADRFDPRRMIQSGMALYLLLLWWICKVPYGPQFRVGGTPPPLRPVKGLADIVQTAPEVARLPLIVPMVLLAGAASFFGGNSYHAQMPGFATDLGHGHTDVT